MLASTPSANGRWITAADEFGNEVALRIIRSRRGHATVVTLADGRHLLVRGRRVFQAVGDGMIYKCSERDAS